MAGKRAAPPVESWRLTVRMIVPVIVVAGVAASVFVVGPLLERPTFPIPVGTVISLPMTAGSSGISYDFSWSPGGRLVGSWTATANTTVTLTLQPSYLTTPWFRFEVVGTSGTFNLSYASGGNYPNMVLSFDSQVPDSIRVVETIQVVYPSITA